MPYTLICLGINYFHALNINPAVFNTDKKSKVFVKLYLPLLHFLWSDNLM